MCEWSPDLDLTGFYLEAAVRGHHNNSNQKILIDSISKEYDWRVWILYNDDIAIGSVGTHSMLDVGPKAYRICARTCVFTSLLPQKYKHTYTLNNAIRNHQNITSQFYIPKCIEYCPEDSDLYITSNNSPEASQRLVHTIYCPTLEKSGCLEKTHEQMYRGHVQTFWKLNKIEFMNQLQQHPQWGSSFYNQQ